MLDINEDESESEIEEKEINNFVTLVGITELNQDMNQMMNHSKNSLKATNKCVKIS